VENDGKVANFASLNVLDDLGARWLASGSRHRLASDRFFPFAGGFSASARRQLQAAFTVDNYIHLTIAANGKVWRFDRMRMGGVDDHH
jgi:hypothetical protein